jgi:hypothetical protein
LNVLYFSDQFARHNKETSEGSKIVFPGQTLSNTVAKFIPQVSSQQPTCANEYGFCENSDSYPQLVVTLTVVLQYMVFMKVSGLRRFNPIYISVLKVRFTPHVQ